MDFLNQLLLLVIVEIHVPVYKEEWGLKGQFLGAWAGLPEDEFIIPLCEASFSCAVLDQNEADLGEMREIR